MSHLGLCVLCTKTLGSVPCVKEGNLMLLASKNIFPMSQTEAPDYLLYTLSMLGLPVDESANIY